MPNRPALVTLTNSSVDVLNAIRNSASMNYQNYVPIATPDADSVRKIGAIIMDNVTLQNEFVNALVNRIGRVIVTSKLYDNPWASFKKGMLEFGENIEEIFVELARAQQYDPSVAESQFAKRVIPDIRSAFHVLNYKKFYKNSIQNNSLRQAFLSWDGITELIAKIVESMYTAANYDEFNVMKYMVARKILDGRMFVKQVDAVTDANMKSIVSAIKGISNDLTFMSTKYNVAGVHAYTNKDNQYLIVNSKFEAQMNVEVLASAFNMDKAEFAGHMVLVDSFGSLDTARLGELFKDDPNYDEISADQLAALDEIPAILVDRDWFMVYDNLVQFDELYIGEGMYWQYWLHLWKTFSVSPFANAITFVPDTPTVTGVTVSPTSANITGATGGTVQVTATVDTTNFAPQEVTYTSDNPAVTVTASGLATVPAGTAAGKAKITATSTFDSKQSAVCTITIA